MVGEKHKERCEYFYLMGKKYGYEECCIHFFIEKAINGTNKKYIGLSTGVILCPSCSKIDEEYIKVLIELTAEPDDEKPYSYFLHPSMKRIYL